MNSQCGARTSPCCFSQAFPTSGALELCHGLLYGFQLVLAVYNIAVYNIAVYNMVEEFALWQNLQFPVCCIVIASSGNVEYVIALLNIFLV